MPDPAGRAPDADGSQSRFDLSCSGSACSITPFTTAPAVSTAAPDCSTTECNFGTPLPIPNGSLTTCVLNTFQSPASNTLDLSTGASSTNVALVSDVYLTGNAAQPCPKYPSRGASSHAGGACSAR